MKSALIIENEPVARLLLKKQIRSFGFEVTTCANGATALEKCQHVFYPLIVLDLGLPDIYGLDLCHQIRATPQGERSVMLVITERHDPEYLQALVEAGADDYLTKPVSTELLKMRVMLIKRQLKNLVEHKQVAEHLWQLEKALETMQLGVTITDTEGKILYTNPAEAEMHGHQVEDLIGSDLHVFAPLELRNPLTLEQLKTLKHRERESLNIRKDGTIFPVRLISDVITNDQGDPVAIFTICEDITEHKQAQERLRFQAQLLDNVRESIIATDLEGHVIYWGKGAEVLYGYTAEEVIGKIVPISAGPFEGFEESEEQERIHQVLETETWSGQYVQQCKDGGMFLSDTVISLMTDQDGKPYGFITMDRDITERNQMEEILRYSEERYRILVESASDNIFMLNENGDFLSVNQAITDNLGKPPKELIGKNLSDIFSKEIAASQLSILKNVFQTGKPCRLPDAFIKTPSGEKWLSTVFTPVTDRHDHIVYVIGIARDITERKQTEEQARFQAQLLNNVRESIFATDLEGHIVYWGKGAEDLYGYAAEDMMDKSITLIVGFRDEEAEYDRIRQVRETGVWSGQYMKRRKDGSFFWADTVMSLVKNRNGQPCGIIGIDRDITEQKYADNAVRASEMQYRLLADELVDGIAIIQRGKVVFVNEALSSLYGHPLQQFLQIDVFKLFCGDYQECFRKWLEQTEQRISDRPFQGLCVTGDGHEVWTEWHPTMIAWEGKPAILLTVRDITESKLREITMKKDKESLQMENVTLRSTIKIAAGENGTISETKIAGNNLELREAVEDFEKKVIIRKLDQNDWHRAKTANSLGLPLRTLHRKMKKYQLI